MLHLLRQQQLMPLFYHDHFDVCLNVVKAAWAAGLHCFEFTSRGPHAAQHFNALMEWKKEYAPGLQLGVGTIKTAEQAQQFMDMGAAFVVSPYGSSSIADACYYNKIPYLPGCMTLKEMAEAREWGVEIVKLFPGEALGPAFLKAVKGPMPELEIMVTGGVNPENLVTWKKAGATAMGLGGSFVTANHLQTQDWTDLQQVFESAVAAVK